MKWEGAESRLIHKPEDLPLDIRCIFVEKCVEKGSRKLGAALRITLMPAMRPAVAGRDYSELTNQKGEFDPCHS